MSPPKVLEAIDEARSARSEARSVSEAAARVVFTTGFSRRYTGGVTEFQVVAKTLRGVIREMDRKFPGLAETLEEETTVAIDGELYEIDFLRPPGRGGGVLHSEDRGG
jgi:hypothetical protein